MTDLIEKIQRRRRLLLAGEVSGDVMQRKTVELTEDQRKLLCEAVRVWQYECVRQCDTLNAMAAHAAGVELRVTCTKFAEQFRVKGKAAVDLYVLFTADLKSVVIDVQV